VVAVPVAWATRNLTPPVVEPAPEPTTAVPNREPV
jgi:hypothetical protein